jgi:hypothetical protein
MSLVLIISLVLSLSQSLVPGHVLFVRYGAWSRFMTRPEYCSVILEKLTESRVLFNKDIASISTIDCAEGNKRAEGLHLVIDDGRQDSMLDIDISMEKGEAQGGVTIECTDGSSYTGHLLVADIESGVDSKVISTGSGWAQGGQQEVYSVNHGAHAKGPTNASATTASTDDTSTPREVHYHVSGVTEALDPQRIPLLREDTTQLRLVMDGRSSLSVSGLKFVCRCSRHEARTAGFLHRRTYPPTHS